jgi:hypothetical protein
MMSTEEIYYELLADLQGFKTAIGKGSTDKPDGLPEILSDAWDKADELEKVLCDEKFEDFI